MFRSLWLLMRTSRWCARSTIAPLAPVTQTNVRLTRQKSALFQWLVVPLWVPTGKDSVPTDSGAFRSQFCGRAIVNAVLIAIENRVRLRAYWSVYEFNPASAELEA